jgi:hypothetical protein
MGARNGCPPWNMGLEQGLMLLRGKLDKYSFKFREQLTEFSKIHKRPEPRILDARYTSKPMMTYDLLRINILIPLWCQLPDRTFALIEGHPDPFFSID